MLSARVIPTALHVRWERFDDDLNVICAILPAVMWVLMMMNFTCAAVVDPGIIPKNPHKPSGASFPPAIRP